MFTGGFFEIGFLLFIAYLLFGPKKLPEIARTLGKGMAELRRASDELKRSLEEEISNLDRIPDSHNEGVSGTLGRGMGELRQASNELTRSLVEGISNLDRIPENRNESVATTTPKYGDHHSEPAHTESEPRT